MSYLRNKISNAVTASLDAQGVVYRALIAQKVAATQQVSPDPSVKGEEGAAFTIRAGEPLWEDIPIERAETFANRVLAGVLDPAGAAVDTRAILSDGLDRDITITAATYTPNAAIKGAETNSRTVSIIDVTEAAAPVTAAKAALVAGVESPAGVEKALGLEEAAKLKVKAGANVVANSAHVGTGIPDPGGIVLVTYTHD